MKTDLKTETRPSFLPSVPRFQTKSCFVHPGNEHLSVNAEGMHSKQKVSLFITITIVTITCVIHAIQQLCNQAVMRTVITMMLYLSHRHGFAFSRHPLTASTTIAPFTPRRFHIGCQIGSGVSYQFLRELIERCLLFSGEEGDSSCISVTVLQHN